MKMNVFMLCIFLLSLKTVVSDMVPVLIFGRNLPTKVPALTGISSNQFLKMLRSEIDSTGTVIVALMAPTFNIEDVSQCQAMGQDGCLYQVSQEFSYIPNVENPGTVLVEKLKAGKSSLKTLLSDIDGGKKFVIVNLDENSYQSSPGKLISNTYKILSERYQDLILIYTGYKSNSSYYTRNRYIKRSIDHLPLESKHILISAESIFEQIGNSNETTTEIQSIATKVNGSSIYATLYPLNVTLKFIKQGNVWSLSSAIKDGLRYKIPGYVSALESYSYRCASNLTFVARNNVIKIHNSQILVNFRHAHPIFDLRKIVYCDGYVTPGILSGLVFSALFLSTLLCGLMSIASIRTMDRFDGHHTKGFIVVQEY